MSTERIVVEDSIGDAFVARLAARAAKLPVGDPRKGACVIGPLITGESSRRLSELIDESVRQGAVRVTGGRVDGPFMQATILDKVTREMRVYDEETFGPVTCVVRAHGVEDAVRLANDTEYGLSAAVFGRDVNRALSVAMRIDSGSCHINGPTVQDEAQAPFGGTKASGYGRFGGRAVIDEFTELRWLTIESPGQHYPF
jgi:salicylaldehyde dehydrogenase